MSKKRQQSKSDATDIEVALREVGDKLRDAIASIEIHGAGEHAATTQELARLSVAFTTVCSELRQSTKAAARMLESTPIDQIVTFLKTLSLEERKDIARDIAGETDEEPLL